MKAVVAIAVVALGTLCASAVAQSRQLLTFEEAKQRADNGDSFAQAVVALHYQLGWDTDKSSALAVKYAKLSADAGEPLGQFRFGALLRAGEGVSKDEQQGLALQAASFDGLKASKDAYSLTAAGILIFQGKVVGQTVPEEQRRRNAAALYKQAADMGYAPGQFNYAMALNDGHGVQRDIAKRDDYLDRALKLNYPLASTFKVELRDLAAKRSSSADKERVTLGIQRPAESPSLGEVRMEEIALGVEPHERLIVFYKPGARSSTDNVEPIVQSESFAFTDSLSSVTGALVHAYTKPNDSGVYLFDAKSKAYLGKVDLDDFPDAGELAHGNPPWGLVLSTDESLLMCQRFAGRGGLVTVLVDTRSLDATKISGRQFLPLIMADGSSYYLVERPQDEDGSLSAYEWGEDEPEIGSVFAQLKQVGSTISWDSLNALKIGESLMDGLQLTSRPGPSQLSSGTFAAESKDGSGASYVEQLDMIADRYLSEKQSALSLLSAAISSHAERENAQGEKARLLEYASVSGGVFELIVRDEQSDVSRANRYTLKFHPEQFRISAFESLSRPTKVAQDFKRYWPISDGGELTSQLVHGTDQENVAWTAKQFEVGKGRNAKKFLWPLSIEARQTADSSYDGMVQYYGGDNQWLVYRTELPTRLGIFPGLGIFSVPLSQWIAATDGAGSAILNLGPSRVYGNPYSAKGDPKPKYFVSAESDYLDYGPLFSFDEDNSSVWLATRMSIDQRSADFANSKLVCLNLENGKIIEDIPNTPPWRVFAVGATRLIASDDPRSGLAQLWERQPLKKIGDLVLREDGNLVFVCSDGVYAASMATKSNLAFKIGNRGYPFEQFDLRLNRPDIVLERLGAPNEAVQIAKQLREKRLKRMGVTEAMLKPDFHVPELEIVGDVPAATDAGEITLAIKARDSKYPLERLKVFVNNVPVNGRDGELLREEGKSDGGLLGRIAGVFSEKSTGPQSVERAIPIKLASGRNKIQVSVLNNAGAESLYANAEVNCTAKRPKPTLYAVALGVSEYSNSDWNLKYAAKDARDVLARLKDKAEDQYGNVKELLLTDKDVTKENLAKVREFLKGATIDDTVLMFAAGHGLLDSKYDYYFGTTDIDFNNPADKGIAFEEFDDLLADLPSLKKSLLIDTCHAGELDDEEKTLLASANGVSAALPTANGVAVRSIGTRGMNVKAVEGARGASEWYERLQGLFVDLRRGSGSTILSSSAGAEYALESSEQQNGLFTYAVLEALDGKPEADANKDGSVQMSELGEYVKKRVSELTNDKQTPNTRRVNLEGDFTVAKTK